MGFLTFKRHFFTVLAIFRFLAFLAIFEKPCFKMTPLFAVLKDHPSSSYFTPKIHFLGVQKHPIWSFLAISGKTEYLCLFQATKKGIFFQCVQNDQIENTHIFALPCRPFLFQNIPFWPKMSKNDPNFDILGSMTSKT